MIIHNSSIKSNMIISGLCKPLSMIISYIYVPIVLNFLGVEKYGIWSTILTILSWISYFDIGIGNGLRNKLTVAISKNDKDGCKTLVSSAYAFIATIITAVIVAFGIAANFINWHRIFGVTDINENLDAIITLAVTFVGLNFILSLCKNVLYAYQKAAYVSLMELMTQIINLLGALVLSKITAANLFGMTAVYGLSMLFVNIIASIVLYHKYPDTTPSRKSINLSAGKDLANLGLKFFIVQICALVLFTTDSLIISMLYGASDVTPYSTVNKLFNAVSSAYTSFLAPIWSIATKDKTEGNYRHLSTIIKKLNLLMIPFMLCSILLAVIFKPLSAWWLGQNLNYTNGLIIWGCLYSCLTMWCNTYANIANGLELMKPSIIIAVVQAIINIPMSLFLAEFMNMKSAGVLAGTVFSMFISAVIQPIIVIISLKRFKVEG